MKAADGVQIAERPEAAIRSAARFALELAGKSKHCEAVADCAHCNLTFLATWAENMLTDLSRAEERERVVTDSPEQMRERCFHDFLRLIRAYMNFMDQEEACVLQRFSGFVEQHGIPGLGTGTCDCGEDDCPYKAASAPCDCGLPDCSDPRSTKGGKA